MESVELSEVGGQGGPRCANLIGRYASCTSMALLDVQCDTLKMVPPRLLDLLQSGSTEFFFNLLFKKTLIQRYSRIRFYLPPPDRTKVADISGWNE